MPVFGKKALPSRCFILSIFKTTTTDKPLGFGSILATSSAALAAASCPLCFSHKQGQPLLACQLTAPAPANHCLFARARDCNRRQLHCTKRTPSRLLVHHKRASGLFFRCPDLAIEELHVGQLQLAPQLRQTAYSALRPRGDDPCQGAGLQQIFATKYVKGHGSLQTKLHHYNTVFSRGGHAHMRLHA